MKLFEKKENKTNSSGPGHLKERNHFDGKDMILLVVMLIIIYGVVTWAEFFAQEKMNAMEQTESTQNTVETIENSPSVDN